jgi:Rps23 Pro-64 3,4-dihydroxylase Tpa1-like proline 4-hydroxylase
MFVVDSALDPADLRMVQALAARSQFRRTETDRAGTRQFSMIADFNAEKLDHAKFIHRILDIARTLFPNPPLETNRVHVNSNAYGDMAYPHRDSVAGGDSVTAMIYANQSWEKDWGGETLFYDGSDEAIACVSPKPGRLVVFHGLIEHEGSIPSRECYEDRLTLVIKMIPCS